MFLTFRTGVLFPIFLLILVKSGLDARKANDGVIAFGEAFKNMFVTGAIGVLLCTLFEYLHFNFISPELIEMQRELAIEAAEKVSELLGGFGEEYEEEMERQLETIEDTNPVSLTKSIANFFHKKKWWRHGR